LKDLAAGPVLQELAGMLTNSSGWGKAAGERIIIDSCPAACAKKIMDVQGLPVERYVVITELGIAKTPGPVFAESDVQTVVDAVKKVLP
jgi:uncharacterized metal-binding protein